MAVHTTSSGCRPLTRNNDEDLNISPFGANFAVSILRSTVSGLICRPLVEMSRWGEQPNHYDLMLPIEREGNQIQRYTRIDTGEQDQHNKEEHTNNTDRTSQGPGVTGEGDYE
eukprot:10801429-Heterocapsa_arctica.AAC.1